METIHAICEEYRAGETVDLALDEEDLRAGRKIRAETLVLWGANGLVERFFRPLECWAKFETTFRDTTCPAAILSLRRPLSPCWRRWKTSFDNRRKRKTAPRRGESPRRALSG